MVIPGLFACHATPRHATATADANANGERSPRGAISRGARREFKSPLRETRAECCQSAFTVSSFLFLTPLPPYFSPLPGCAGCLDRKRKDERIDLSLKKAIVSLDLPLRSREFKDSFSIPLSNGVWRPPFSILTPFTGYKISKKNSNSIFQGRGIFRDICFYISFVLFFL